MWACRGVIKPAEPHSPWDVCFIFHAQYVLFSGVPKRGVTGDQNSCLLTVQKAPIMQQETPSSALNILENRWADPTVGGFSTPRDP